MDWEASVPPDFLELAKALAEDDIFFYPSNLGTDFTISAIQNSGAGRNPSSFRLIAWM